MQKISIVIVCKNEADVIGTTLESLAGITDDIVLFDNGSQDDTITIAKKFPVQIHQGSWDGFGKTKQKATVLAKYDWVLTLDADEAIDEELKQSLLELSLNNEKEVFTIHRKNFIGNRHLKYGEWGSDKQTRLFNRKIMNWNDAVVHEKLELPAGTTITKLKGHLLHRTMRDMQDYSRKMVQYAMLNAEKYRRQGKKASWFKIRIAPGFAFFKYFILKGGFLDGYIGYICAKMTAYYTFLKYTRLRELSQESGVRSRESREAS